MSEQVTPDPRLEAIGGFSVEQIREALFVRGPWEDETLDVPRAELLEYMAPAFEESLSDLEDSRARGSWTPADAFLAAGSGKGEMYTRRAVDGKRLTAAEATVLNEEHPLWRNAVGEMLMLSTDLEPARLYIPDTKELIIEAKSLDAVQLSALYVDGLTEDNLPNYGRLIAAVFGNDEAATAFLRQWLADEDLHKLSFDLYMHLAQPINPFLLEQQRTKLIKEGVMPSNEDPFTLISYVCMQEPATKVSHRNTNMPQGNPMGQILGHVSKHEHEHGEAYQKIAAELVKAYPEQMIIGFEKALFNFNMPGSDIDNFKHHAAILSWAGVYDAADFYKIATEVVSKIGLFDQDYDSLHPEAQKSLENIQTRLRKLSKFAQRLESQREKAREKGESKEFKDPFAVGFERTVQVLPFSASKQVPEPPTL